MSIDDMIQVLQAAKEGKQVQFRRKEHPDWNWEDRLHLPFDFETYDFRVKPQPRELWLQECPAQGIPTGLWQEKFRGIGIHFREVLK